MNGYAGSFMTASAADHYQAQQRKEQEALLGNKWHQKMGFQKPTNLDQSINHIRQTEYAPFTREQEPPSIANMYLQQQYGGRERMQEDGYAIEEVEQEPSGRQMSYRRTSSSPDRGGQRRPGPEWGNSHFGTKPRRRSIVEDQARQIYDDNAPPLASFYDDLIAEEENQKKHETHITSTHHHNIQSSNPRDTLGLGPSTTSATPMRKFYFDNPKAVRVSNYTEARWPDVLVPLSRFGNILERFDGIPKNSYYEQIPIKLIAESDDPVVRDARMLYTGEGWTKITYATREAADTAIGMSGAFAIGGRNIVIEPWSPDTYTARANINGEIEMYSAPPPPPSLQQNTFSSATISNTESGLPFSTSMATGAFIPSSTATTNTRRRRNSTFQDSDPLDNNINNNTNNSKQIQFSSKMPGARVIVPMDVPGGVFVKKPGFWSKLLSWIWGDLTGSRRYGADGHPVPDNSWSAWVTEKLFGKL